MAKGNLKYFRAVLKFAFSKLDELFADHQKIVTSLCELVPRSFKKITLKDLKSTLLFYEKLFIGDILNNVDNCYAEFKLWRTK